MKVVNEFLNKLLKRKEIRAAIDDETNPGFEKSRKNLASELGVDENLVVVKAVRGKFGSHSFLIDAFIYNTVEDKEMIEPKKKVKGGTAAA